MPAPNSRTIKGKLTKITLLTCCVVLLLASTIFIGIQTVTYRRDIVRELATVTNIIGSNSTAAVVFDDRQAGREILSALSAKPNIVSAMIFATDGLLFARYSAVPAGETGREPPAELPQVLATLDGAEGHMLDLMNGHVDLYAPIRLDGETIGSIIIRSGLSELYDTLWICAWVAAPACRERARQAELVATYLPGEDEKGKGPK